MVNQWKKGDWLVIDQESGLQRYASEVAEDWKGIYVKKRYADGEQPQMEVRPEDDPRPLPFYSLPNYTYDLSTFFPVFIGETTVRAPRTGAAVHLFDPGIGDMIVGQSFFVR